jgi:hypothetical protein
VIASGILVAITLAGGPAAASTHVRDAGFAAQGRSAGLSDRQITGLPKEVGAYIHRFGGTQVAINKVNFSGGSALFVVPGEKYVRQLAGTSSESAIPATGETCPYHVFCAYQGQNFTGNAVEVSACDTSKPIVWTAWGSWKNDQTPGQVAYIWGDGNGYTYTTPPAYSNDTRFSWKPVGAIQAC